MRCSGTASLAAEDVKEQELHYDPDQTNMAKESKDHKTELAGPPAEATAFQAKVSTRQHTLHAGAGQDGESAKVEALELAPHFSNVWESFVSREIPQELKVAT